MNLAVFDDQNSKIGESLSETDNEEFIVSLQAGESVWSRVWVWTGDTTDYALNLDFTEGGIGVSGPGEPNDSGFSTTGHWPFFTPRGFEGDSLYNWTDSGGYGNDSSEIGSSRRYLHKIDNASRD